MISVYQFKPKFQELLFPVLHFLHKHKISANQITMGAIIWSALLGALLFLSPAHPVYMIFVAVGLLIRMALNALDGMMARTYNQQSKKGEILNEMGDILSDTFIFCGLFGFYFGHHTFLFLFIIMSVINEFAGVLAKTVSGARRYDGPMGKSDRALFIGLWCILYFLFPVISFVFNSLLCIVILLLIISTCKRLSNSLK